MLDKLKAVAIQHWAMESMRSVGPFKRYQTKLGAAIRGEDADTVLRIRAPSWTLSYPAARQSVKRPNATMKLSRDVDAVARVKPGA